MLNRGVSSVVPAATVPALQTMRPALGLVQPAGSAAMRTSSRKSMVTTTLCASLTERKLPTNTSSVNGKARSCRTGACSNISTSGPVTTVSVSEAVLLAVFSSGVLLVSVAVVVSGPAVAGATKSMLNAACTFGGTSPRLASGMGTLEAKVTFTSLATPGPGLCTVKTTLL